LNFNTLTKLKKPFIAWLNDKFSQLQPYFYDNIFLTTSPKIHKTVLQYAYKIKAHSKPPKAYTRELHPFMCNKRNP
jgi:hypothetical protein